jgi:predicted acylesterase/phospholipase RssA
MSQDQDFDRYCDLTMRGGTTSGVVYPLAACALAEHYEFRSLGGSSAGAIAAAFTAAAEHGRSTGGFTRLAEVIDWFTSGQGADQWRLAQLFQPSADTHKLYRFVAASMQRRETTGKSALTCLLIALLGAIGLRAKAALGLALLLWFTGPTAWFLSFGWGNTPAWVQITATAVIAVAVLSILVRIRNALPRRKSTPLVWLRRVGTGLLVASPLLPVLWRVSWTTPDVASLAIAALWWLVLGFAVVSAVAVTYGLATQRFLARMASRIHFGLVPGTGTYQASFWDRRAGVPKSTGVPPLSDWLADRIDHVAGTECLTFGDLDVNLVLMTTDVSQGRPYRLPFTDTATRWLFCVTCLHTVLPQRVVAKLGVEETAHRCPLHPDETLRELPPTKDLPVVLAVRMSMPMPGLIAAVPLVRAEPEPRVHWFSDGGITSNFPIHFFDSLLPRWPTFGLSLQSYPTGGSEDVWLPEQDASTSGTPWRPIGSMPGFLGSILDTMLDWRDTMQSALPGYRGRIAHVRLRGDEGGTNLFMLPTTIAELAARGRKAGELLRTRFTEDGAAKTDRYRWIRMRIAMREYQELAAQADERRDLYGDLVDTYRIPEDLHAWFQHPPEDTDPCAPEIRLTLDAVGDLVKGPFDGAPPVDPDLRLTPPE